MTNSSSASSTSQEDQLWQTMINDITCDVSRHQARKSKRGLTLAGLGGLIGNTSYKHLWPKFKTLIKENKKVQHLELRGKYVYTTRVISSAVTNVKSNHAKDMRAETIRRATAFVNKHNGTVGIRLARAGVLHDDDQAIADEWNKLARQWRDGKRVGSLQMLNGNLTTDKPTEGKSTGAATSLRGRDVVIHRVKTLLRVRGPSHVGSIGGGVCRKKKKYKSTWRGLLRRLRKKRIVSGLSLSQNEILSIVTDVKPGEVAENEEVRGLSLSKSQKSSIAPGVNPRRAMVANEDDDDNDKVNFSRFEHELEGQRVMQKQKQQKQQQQQQQQQQLVKLSPSMPTYYVDNIQLCNAARDILLDADVLGFDCEGSLEINDRFYLRLVQIGVVNKDMSGGAVFLFDLKVKDEECVAEMHNILKIIMKSNRIEKIFHDCRLDVPAICHEININLEQVDCIFDTQIAYQVLSKAKLVKSPNGPRASLNDVLKAFELPLNSRKRKFHDVFDTDESVWHREQLSNDRIEYAADDVRYLHSLRKKLKKSFHQGLFKWSKKYTHWYDGKREADKDIVFDQYFAMGFSVVEASSPRHEKVQLELQPVDEFDSNEPGPVAPPARDPQVDRDFIEEFEKFRSALPLPIQEYLNQVDELDVIRAELMEVRVIAGRNVLLKMRNGKTKDTRVVVTKEDIVNCVERWNDEDIHVGADHRAVLSGTLHRLSLVRNRLNDPIGVTARVGKHCPGAAKLLQDVVDAVMHEKKSLLLVGQPGAGKTTMLREISALISRPFGADNDYRHNVIVIDKSNEIAGDGDEPHPAIGNAVRHQVPLEHENDQAETMSHAVCNHSPNIIVIDEITSKAEAKQASVIKEKGVTLVATVHGESLAALRSNLELNTLLGGFQAVTIGDKERKNLGASSKTLSNRMGKPIFDIIVELKQVGEYVVHYNVADSVDALLATRGSNTPAALTSRRRLDENQTMWIQYEQYKGSARARVSPGATNAYDWLESLY